MPFQTHTECAQRERWLDCETEQNKYPPRSLGPTESLQAPATHVLY